MSSNVTMNVYVPPGTPQYQQDTLNRQAEEITNNFSRMFSDRLERNTSEYEK